MSERPVGFDAAAPRYDSDEFHNRAIRHMRVRGHRHLAATFAREARLLELGSGTGTDASWLAARGASVALLDVSPRLLTAAQAKVRAARSDALLGAHELPASRVGELVSRYGEGYFHGAYSSLGPLNCEPSLEPVAAGLSALVRPGGALLFSVLNRWCVTETAWFALHGQWREAARRWGGPIQATAYAGGPRDVTVWYLTIDAVRRAFSPAFELEYAEALPLLWPPSYLTNLLERAPRLFHALEPWEARLAARPVLRALGDHVLVRLRRRGNRV